MQTEESVAGVVRLQPGSAGDDDAAPKKGRGQQGSDASLLESQGAKEKTSQANNSRQQRSNASSSGTLQSPREWMLPDSRQSSKDAGQPPAKPAPGAKEKTGQKERRQPPADSSESEDFRDAMEMELEPMQETARASTSPTATDMFSSTNLNDKKNQDADIPPLPTVPEGGETGGGSFSRLSEVGQISAARGSPPKATQPQCPITHPKVVVINPNPSGQGKIAQAYQILAAIQVDARACRIDIPELSMAIMEGIFDKEALVPKQYIVTLPEAVKEMILEEAEIFVPGEDDTEVRFEVVDATEDGDIIQKPAPNTAAATGPSYRPQAPKRRDKSAQIICIYRMDRQQLGRVLNAGSLQNEVACITAHINAAFEDVDFNYNINFDQPTPMNSPINQLTAYIEHDKEASSEQLAKIVLHKLKFVKWNLDRRPFICYIPNDILKKYECRPCCFHHYSECSGESATSQCSFKVPKPPMPRPDRKREREEAKAAEVEQELQRLERKSRDGLCEAYKKGQESCAILISLLAASPNSHPPRIPAVPFHQGPVLRTKQGPTQKLSQLSAHDPMLLSTRLLMDLHVCRRHVPVLRSHHSLATDTSLRLGLGPRRYSRPSSQRSGPMLEADRPTGESEGGQCEVICTIAAKTNLRMRGLWDACAFDALWHGTCMWQPPLCERRTVQAVTQSALRSQTGADDREIVGWRGHVDRSTGLFRRHAAHDFWHVRVALDCAGCGATHSGDVNAHAPPLLVCPPPPLDVPPPCSPLPPRLPPPPCTHSPR